MENKPLAVGIIFLLFSISIIPSTAQDTEKVASCFADSFNYKNNYENTKIVAFGNSPIIYVPDDFPTIQSAIDNATAGYTIIVRNGTYVENLVVDKPLVIQSEFGYSNCIIHMQDSSGEIIKISSDSVSIIGFNITGLNGEIRAGISHIRVNHTTIVGNKFFKIGYGPAIRSQFSNNNTFHDNLFGSNRYRDTIVYGIWLEYSDSNLIYNNFITEIWGGASIDFNHCSHNIIVNNYLLGGYYCMELLSSQHNVIMNNTIGPGIVAQMVFSNSSYNLFSNNTFLNAAYNGIRLELSENNTFTYNKFSKSGIYFFESYHNIFQENMINGKPFVCLEDKSHYVFDEDAGQLVLINCDNITVTNQNLSENNIGLELFRTHDSTISNSIFYDNTLQGIYGAYSNNNRFINLTFLDNEDGISLSQCNESDISYCHYNSNGWVSCSISLGSCSKNYIHNNTFIGRVNNVRDGNNYGISMGDSDYNIISSNKFTNHRNYGLSLTSSNNNIISYNYIQNNGGGCSTYRSENNTICFNNFSYNSIGLDITEGSYDNINNNSFYANSDGISIWGNFDLIYHNDFRDNTGVAIYSDGWIKIEKNNLINNKIQATFFIDFLMEPFPSRWINNYWDNLLGNGPKIIVGIVNVFSFMGDYGIYFAILLPWVNFDRNPAQEPYDIPRMR